MALQYRQQQAYGHAERIFDVQFRPGDSSVVASASEDCTVRVWRHDRKTAKYKQVLCCYGHEAEVMRLGWSLDGQLLASGSADNTVRVWQMPEDMSSTGASYRASQVALLEGHPEEVYHCEFVIPGMCVEPQPHPSCSHSLQPEQENSQSTYGAAQSSSAHQNGGSGRQHVKATVSTQQCTNGHQGSSKQCDSGRAETAGFVDAPPDFPYGPGTHLLVASSESLFLWDLEAGVLQQQADAPGTSGSTVPPDAVVHGYKHAYIFAVARQSRPASRGTQGGQMLACACNDGLVRLWSLQQSGLQYVGNRQVAPLGPAPVCALTTLCWNSSGTQLVVAAKDGTVCVLDARKQLKATHSWRLPCAVLTVTTLPQSSPLLERQQHSGAPQEMILLGCSDGRVLLYPWTQPDPGYVPQEVCILPAGSGFSVLALSVSPTCDALAVAGSPVMQPTRTQADTTRMHPSCAHAQHALPHAEQTVQGQTKEGHTGQWQQVQGQMTEGHTGQRQQVQQTSQLQQAGRAGGGATGVDSAPSRRRSGRRGTVSSSGSGPLAALDISVTDLQLQSPTHTSPGAVLLPTPAVHSEHVAVQAPHQIDRAHVQSAAPAAQDEQEEGDEEQEEEEEEEEEEGHASAVASLHGSDEELDGQDREHTGHHDKPITMLDTNIRAPVFVLLPQTC